MHTARRAGLVVGVAVGLLAAGCSRGEITVETGDEPGIRCQGGVGGGTIGTGPTSGASSVTSSGAGSTTAASTSVTVGSGPATTAASSSAASGAGGSTSTGPRLRSYFRQAEDGTTETIPGRWFDSTRLEDCTFRLAADGVSRCLPFAAPVQLRFADADCAIPVAAVPVADCAGWTPEYVATVAPAVTSACMPQARLYRTGYPVQLESLYRREGAACVSMGTPYEAGVVASELGAEVPPSAFVGATDWHY